MSIFDYFLRCFEDSRLVFTACFVAALTDHTIKESEHHMLQALVHVHCCNRDALSGGA